MNCVSCGICVYHLWFVFFPGVFLSSRVTGACPVTTDLIMRVNVKTTTIATNYLEQPDFRNYFCGYDPLRYYSCKFVIRNSKIVTHRSEQDKNNLKRRSRVPHPYLVRFGSGLESGLGLRLGLALGGGLGPCFDRIFGNASYPKQS